MPTSSPNYYVGLFCILDGAVTCNAIQTTELANFTLATLPRRLPMENCQRVGQVRMPTYNVPLPTAYGKTVTDGIK